MNPDAVEGTSAADTLQGSDSKDVNTGVGKPMQGQTQTEIRHDGQHKRKAQKLGLAGQASHQEAQHDPADERVDERQRALDKEEAVQPRGDKDGLKDPMDPQ